MTMTGNEYQQLAHRTECDQVKSAQRAVKYSVQTSPCNVQNIRLIHSALGLASDLGELKDSENQTNFIEEVGDMMWYLAEAFNALDQRMIFPESYKEDLIYPTSVEESNDSVLEQVSEYCYLIEKRIYYGQNILLYDLVKALDKILTALNCLVYYKKTDLATCAEANIRKLQKRFPDKFDEDKNNNRDRQKEAEALRAEDDGVSYD